MEDALTPAAEANRVSLGFPGTLSVPLTVAGEVLPAWVQHDGCLLPITSLATQYHFPSSFPFNCLLTLFFRHFLVGLLTNGGPWLPSSLKYSEELSRKGHGFRNTVWTFSKHLIELDTGM